MFPSRQAWTSDKSFYVNKTGDNLTRGKKQGNDNPRQERTLEAVACTQ
jgi:hypothetical protein